MDEVSVSWVLWAGLARIDLEPPSCLKTLDDRTVEVRLSAVGVGWRSDAVEKAL